MKMLSVVLDMFRAGRPTDGKICATFHFETPPPIIAGKQ
jgi:hypothetical protein